LGYSDEELLNHPFLNYVHPEDQVITQKEIDKLQTGISTIQFENRWICKDKSVKWLLWSASPDFKTGLLYAVAHDVTGKKILNSPYLSPTLFLIYHMTYLWLLKTDIL
jgi:PAS domain S-box-containing protein